MRLAVSVTQAAVVTIESVAIIARRGARYIRVGAAALGIDGPRSTVPVITLFLMSVEFINDRVVGGVSGIQWQRHDRIDGGGDGGLRSF